MEKHEAYARWLSISRQPHTLLPQGECDSRQGILCIGGLICDFSLSSQRWAETKLQQVEGEDESCTTVVMKCFPGV